MSGLPTEVEAVLREFVNALAKASMYPPGHKFVVDASERLAEQLALSTETRGSLTLGITPRGLLVDGATADPLPTPFRQLAARLHRRNVGTLHFSPGVGRDEITRMLLALGASDADTTVGQEGLRLTHLRIEPLVYDVLAFGDPSTEADLDEVFWSRLVEAAYGRRLADGEAVPTPVEIAEEINQRAIQSQEGARRVYEALASFASALAARGERASGGARRKFVEVLSSLSRPATTRVMGAAPTTASRRRFMRETLDQVPPALLLQLLESVAEADGEPISPHLRWLLGKLAGQEGGSQTGTEGAFATQVMGLVEQWDGVDNSSASASDDSRVGVEDSRTIAVGLETSTVGPAVLAAAHRLSGAGSVGEVLKLLDHPATDKQAARIIADTVLGTGLLARLLADPRPDWPLIDRVAFHSGTEAVDVLLDRLGTSEDRTARRRMLDLLTRMGEAAEMPLRARMEGAPWYLVRNILVVMGQLPPCDRGALLLPMLRHEETRVRQEALKVLLRDPVSRERSISEALVSADPALVRLAMAALAGSCPPSLVAPVLSVMAIDDEEIQLQAIRLVGGSESILIVPPLLDLVRTKGGLLRRWKLRPSTPVMRAALEVLARRWQRHRPVVVAIQLASRSPDPEVRTIIEGAR